jgi:hypothetical protein
MNTYTYAIMSMNCAQTDPLKPDLVVSVQVAMNSVDPSDKTAASMTAMIPMPPSDNFTPFKDLTKEQVESWVNNSPLLEQLHKNLDEQIIHRRNPPFIDRLPPWVPPRPMPPPVAITPTPPTVVPPPAPVGTIPVAVL